MRGEREKAREAIRVWNSIEFVSILNLIEHLFSRTHPSIQTHSWTHNTYGQKHSRTNSLELGNGYRDVRKKRTLLKIKITKLSLSLFCSLC